MSKKGLLNRKLMWVFLFVLFLVSGALAIERPVVDANSEYCSSASKFHVIEYNGTLTASGIRKQTCHTTLSSVANEVNENGLQTRLKVIHLLGNYTHSGAGVTIGTRGQYHVWFDLNGYQMTSNSNSTFINITSHQTKVISTGGVGTIKSTSSNANALPIRVVGEVVSWTPEVIIGQNVVVESNGNHAVINLDARLTISGATVKSRSYAIKQTELQGTNSAPTLTINHLDSVVYGINIEPKAGTDTVSNVIISNGTLLPYEGRGGQMHYLVQII